MYWFTNVCCDTSKYELKNRRYVYLIKKHSICHYFLLCGFYIGGYILISIISLILYFTIFIPLYYIINFIKENINNLILIIIILCIICYVICGILYIHDLNNLERFNRLNDNNETGEERNIFMCLCTVINPKNDSENDSENDSNIDSEEEENIV
jgi:hypothetical protein